MLTTSLIDDTVVEAGDRSVLIPDSRLIAPLIKQRREWGVDLYDEVWDGVYVMHALPSDEHQDIVMMLSYALVEVVQIPRLGEVRPGINLASTDTNWKNDYRCPDVVAFLKGNASAKCHDSFWTGGPDLAVEILVPSDETSGKIDFYAKVGTKELLAIDRDPWRLDLHRHDGQALPVAASGPFET